MTKSVDKRILRKESAPSLIQKCLSALELPTNPIGKTAQIIIGKIGKRLDNSMGGIPEIINYKELKDFMGQISSVEAWLGENKEGKYCCLNMFITSFGGNYRTVPTLCRASHIFDINANGICPSGTWDFNDELPDIGDIKMEKVQIILRIL